MDTIGLIVTFPSFDSCYIFMDTPCTWYGVIKDESDEAGYKHARLEKYEQELVQDL